MGNNATAVDNNSTDGDTTTDSAQYFNGCCGNGNVGGHHEALLPTIVEDSEYSDDDESKSRRSKQRRRDSTASIWSEGMSSQDSETREKKGNKPPDDDDDKINTSTLSDNNNTQDSQSPQPQQYQHLPPLSSGIDTIGKSIPTSGDNNISTDKDGGSIIPTTDTTAAVDTIHRDVISRGEYQQKAKGLGKFSIFVLIKRCKNTRQRQAVRWGVVWDEIECLAIPF